jgi:hypothetical protein
MRNRRWMNPNATVLVLCVGVGCATAATLSSCSSNVTSGAGVGGTVNGASGGSASTGTGGSSTTAAGGQTSVAGCTSVGIGGASSGAWPVVNVDLIPAKDGSAPYTQVIGHPWDGPPVPELLTKTAEVGSCQLLKVKNPSCAPPACNAAAIQCVGDNQWARIPVKVAIGDLAFDGLTLQSGGTSFTLSPINNTYQAAGATGVAYPPCDVGANVTVGGGEGTANAFSLTAQCIEPLVVTNTQPLPFERGKAAQLTWTAPSGGNSRVAVEIDISHHEGLKGLIRCDTTDTGALSVDASLVTGLIDFGTAGFPEAALTRHSTSTTAVGTGTATLNIQTTTAVSLQIPGVVSCNDATPCPSGQSCVGMKCV